MTDDLRSESVPDEPIPLTRKEKRRRLLLLALLCLLLLFVGLAGAFWLRNRMLPVPHLAVRGTVVPPRYLYSITGDGEGRLSKPIGVDVARDGRVYISDLGNRRISVFSANGTYLFSFNDVDGKKMRSPTHLQVEGQTVWVSERRLRKLLAFDLEGNYLSAYEATGRPALTWSPLAFGFDRRGQLRATDVGNSAKHRLLFFSAEGSLTATIGKTAQVSSVLQQPGFFFFPNGLAVGRDGSVFVADGNNRRLQVFNRAGGFMRFIDTGGIPRGIALDARNRLYVVDALGHAVDIFRPDGRLLTSFGERGFGAGQFYFPNDIAVDGRGRIYVSDKLNNQIQVWGWPPVVSPPKLPSPPWAAALCLLPLLLVPLLLLLRRRRYVLTAEFVESLARIGRLDALRQPKTRFTAPLHDAEKIAALLAEKPDAEELVSFEEHSQSDALAYREKLRCTEEQAVYLAMADRTHALLTDDIELRRLALLIEVRVLDTTQFLASVDPEVIPENA